MIRRLLAGFALLVSLLLVQPAHSHFIDPLELAPVAPADGAQMEALLGEMRELIVEDRVANATVRYRSLLLDDGTTMRLSGDAGAFAHGSRVQVSGRRNGTTLFVSDVRPAGRGHQNSAAAKTSEVEGTLRMYHVDYLEEGHSHLGYDVVDESDAVTPIRLGVHAGALQRGMRVVVRGALADDGAIDPRVITIIALNDDPLQKVTQKAARTDNILVILMRFNDSPAQPFTQAQAQAVWTGGPGSGSVSEYFKEVSFNQQLMNVTVTPWLSTGVATPAGCNWTQMGSLGRTAAAAAGYSTSGYHKIVYVFPRVSACGWLGLAYIGGSGAWINGANTTLVYGHELGHNFGLLHAATLDCGAAVIGGSCSVAEYGDPFDIMGNKSAMHVNAFQKADMGWIAASTVRTHAAGSATYTLSPLETAGGGTYAVKISAAANRTYWLEYRKPIGFDAGIASYPNDGAIIHVATPFETLCGGCDSYSNDTQLLDTTPATSTFTDAALLAGRSFTDTKYGITVNVLGATPTALTVQVVGPGASVSTTTLNSALNPALLGASVAFTATVSGSSPTGNVTFRANGATIGGCSAVALTGTGNSRSAVCATALLAVGSHSIVAQYNGDGTNPSSTSAALSQVVNPSAPASAWWVDDAIPAGGTAGGDEAWTWVTTNPLPHSGSRVHQSSVKAGLHQHYFDNATTRLSVAPGDSLVTYVYLDPANVPSQVMLQWNDGSWEHRAYWGANLISWGTNGTASRRYMGALPAAGQWVRLSVPAAQVGLEGRTVKGMAFTLYGGRATWDAAGKVSGVAAQVQIAGVVNAGASALSGVAIAASNGGSCTSTNSTGAYTCTVASGWSGVVTPSLAGYTFSPSSRPYSNVTANVATQSYAATVSLSAIWVDDALPVGGVMGGDESWSWVTTGPAPLTGSRAHQSSIKAGLHQHHFNDATSRLLVGAGDTLIAYVYLDPANVPSQVMLQWNDGTWEHRAYWGANLIGWGTNGTASRRYMGPLPSPGQWVRLSVPAAQVGLEGRSVKGMAFTLYGGRATWDTAGKMNAGALATLH